MRLNRAGGYVRMRKTLRENIRQLRALAARTLAPPALLEPEPIEEKIHVCGHIRAREVPFETREEWIHWWLGEFDSQGKMLRLPRMSDREKERYTVAESSNILVSSGITQLLNYLGSASGNSTGFAQWFATGNIALSNVNTNDTSVAGEFFRSQPSQATISGVQQDLSVFVGSTQGVGTNTNAGLFGNGATSTLGSGTLMTHSLFQYTKANGVAVTYDYLLAFV